ncbi:MAG: DUF5723 family protein [Bacteroidota bacterium]|nr:DUF5723 family protein [Bacteroidota bacterium]
MKRGIYFYLICIGCLLFSNATLAQPFMPFYGSSYSGVTGVELQPASIAESKFKYDITLLGGSVGFHGNYFNMHNSLMFNPGENGFPRFMLKKFVNVLTNNNTQSDNFIMNLHDKFHETVVPNFEGNYKAGTIFGEAQLLNIMVALSDKSSLAFAYKQKAFVNVDINSKNGFSQIEQYYYNKNNASQVDPQFNYLNGVGVWWHEFGLNYSQVLLNKNKHVLKGGITGKLIIPKASIYIHTSDLNIDIWGAESLKQANYTGTLGNAILGRSWNGGGIGFSADFGVEYEYRPDPNKARYEMDGQTGILDRSENAYLFKVGLSLLDVGLVKNKGEAYTASSINNNYTEIDTWDHLISATAQRTANSYNIKMPTVLSAQFDWNIGKGYYLNLIPYWAFNSKGQYNIIKVHSFSSYNLTPRFEKKKWGIFLPLQYDQFNKANVGFAFRVGPFWLGSSTVLSNALKAKNNFATDIHFLIKLPILYKRPKDRDNDKVSDKNDLCPDVPGLVQFQGCPDSDGDGVPDNLDKCPNTPSGVKVDKNGCPLDSDGDGIPDYLDQCPDTPAGVKVDKNGCPLDTDGDGIPDYLDKCPDTPAGVAVDKDGCPLDSDGDGVPDYLDKCPGTPAGTSVDKDGCPLVNKSVTVNLNMDNNNPSSVVRNDKLQFDFNKATIRKSSYPLLDKLAEKLKSEKKMKVNLEGHTDSIGSDGYNMILSQKRAQSVKLYFLHKGVQARQITLKGYGKTRPIATNKTSEGRQKNRRVEIK